MFLRSRGEAAFGFFCDLFYFRVGMILSEPPKPHIVVSFTTTSAKFQVLSRQLILETASVLSCCFIPSASSCT